MKHFVILNKEYMINIHMLEENFGYLNYYELQLNLLIKNILLTYM